MKKRIMSLAVAFTAAAATMAFAAPANAAGCSGLRLYYNSNQQGSSACFTGNSVSNFAGYVFTTTGAGQGQSVKNNAASATNYATYATFSWPTAKVYFNSNWAGVYDEVAPSSSRNLKNTYNENASLYWVL